MFRYVILCQQPHIVLSSILPSYVQPDISHSGLGVADPSSMWQIPDRDDNLNNEHLQSLTGRSRQINPNAQHFGSSATNTATYPGQYQRACVVPDPNRNAIHAPVPLQYQPQPRVYYT